MKLIIAIIQPEELPDIKEELIRRKIYKSAHNYKRISND